MIFKIASATILSVEADNNSNSVFGEDNWVFNKKPDMLYFVARAVSANVPNGNGDYFSEDELRRAYQTFIGKGLFLNHASSDVEKQRGKIIDAKYIDASPNKYVKCLVEMNAKAYPELASMIRAGHTQDVSMGCEVAYSTCSICSNRAKIQAQYCLHIKMHKGGVYGVQPVYEINHDINFIELSIVTRGADSAAKILEVFARKNGLNYDEVLEKYASGNLDISTIHAEAEGMEYTIFQSIKRAKQIRLSEEND